MSDAHDRLVLALIARFPDEDLDALETATRRAMWDETPFGKLAETIHEARKTRDAIRRRIATTK